MLRVDVALTHRRREGRLLDRVRVVRQFRVCVCVYSSEYAAIFVALWSARVTQGYNKHLSHTREYDTVHNGIWLRLRRYGLMVGNTDGNGSMCFCSIVVILPIDADSCAHQCVRSSRCADLRSKNTIPRVNCP